ncbi:hypothetical protein NN561_005121 [Cricetulus griseus]
MTSGPASPLAKVTALSGRSPLRPETCEHPAHPGRRCLWRPGPPARASPAARPCPASEAPARVRDTLTVSSSCSPADPHRLAGLYLHSPVWLRAAWDLGAPQAKRTR